MANFQNYQNITSIMNFDENTLDLNLDNSFPFLEINGNILESNYHSISFIQNYTQNLDKFLEFSNKNTEKLKNEDKIENLSSIKYMEDIPDSENNDNINNFINTAQQFFLFSSGDYNDYSKNIINEVSDAFKNERKKRIRFDKHGNEKKNGRKIKNILKRKDNTDNIRKKIICKFFKNLKNKINIILESELKRNIDLVIYRKNIFLNLLVFYQKKKIMEIKKV